MESLPLGSQTEWDHLVRVSWIVLIPVGVLLALVLYKLAMLLNALLEFVSLAKYELTPTMQDLRLTAEHVEAISRKASHGVDRFEQGVAATGPAMQSVKQRVLIGAQSLLGGLKQAFRR